MTAQSLLLEPAPWRIARWAFAVLLVVGLHAGSVALALMQWPEEDTSLDAPGVITMELAPLTTSARHDEPDLPPGPVMQEAAPAQPTTKRVIEEVKTEVPNVEPSPAPNPEVALPQPNPEKKDPEEKPDEKAAQEQKVEQTVAAPATTAPVKVEAPVADTTAAPVQGTSNVALLAQASWQKKLINHLNAHKRYPPEARAHGQSGAVKVQFSIDRTGRVVAAQVLASSGSRYLDEEALAVLHRSSPLPAPPESLITEPTVVLILPIQFTIR